MLLAEPYDALAIHRKDKIIIAEFLKPHRVISTCRAAGGLRDDLGYLYNHQVCEPAGGHCGATDGIWHDPEEYRRRICLRHGLPPTACATLGTAANMNNAAIRKESFRWLTVAAAATGGVETNAGRAGDPASVFEQDGQFENLEPTPPPDHGTINVMVFINHELTPGAMVRSVMTATEAKTAALQELAVNSRYSNRLATGTGTDQVGVACLLGSSAPLTSAGKHSKLGELLGRTVHDAVKQTLAIQNQLTPAGQCSVRIHLERFGATREKLLEGVKSRLSPAQAKLLADNYEVMNRDPLTAAAVAALVHLKDKLDWGVLPAQCRADILSAHAAQAAAAVSGKYERISQYREELAPAPGLQDDQGFLELAFRALAAGYRDKWDHAS